MFAINEGYIFRIHRKSRRLSTQKIADLSNIAYSRINEFENGKSRLSEDKVKALYQSIDIDYQISDSAQAEVQDIVNALYHKIIKCRPYDLEYQKLVLIKPFVQCTPAYITWMLGDFIYATFTKYNFFAFDFYISVLERCLIFMDNFNKQLFYDALGVYHKDNKRYEMAIECFDKGLDSAYFNVVTAMILYHKVNVLTCIGSFHDAISYIKKAKKEFDRHLYIERSLMCSGSLASMHCCLKNYSEAEKINLQCIEAGKEVNLPSWKIQVSYNNLLWCYLLSEQYDKILDYHKEALDIDNEDADMMLYIGYAYWRLGNIEGAKLYLRNARRFIQKATEHDKLLIEALYSMIYDKPYEVIEKKLLNLLQLSIKCIDYDVEELALKLLVENSEKHEKNKKLIKYQKS